MKKVVIVTTGGTIAMVKKGESVVPYEKGNILISEIPELSKIKDAKIDIVEFSNIPSPHICGTFQE